MTQNIDETNKTSEGGLENMPKALREETESILAEIQQEEDLKNPKPKEDPEKPQKSEEEKKDDEKKSEEDKSKTGEEGSKDNKRREPTLVPAWKQKVMEKQASKREEELLAEIETLKKAGAKPEDKDVKKEEPKTNDVKSIVDKIVEKHQVEDPDVIKSIFEEVESLINDKSKTPQDVLEKLKDVDALKEEIKKGKIEIEIANEEKNFNSDFDKIILPMIKAEYGETIPAEKISEIKAKLKEIAYTEQYAKVPYNEIYHGKGDFRNLYTAPKRSAEGGRTSIDLGSGKKVFSEDLTDEEFNKLTPEEQEEYGNQMARKERNRG